MMSEIFIMDKTIEINRDFIDTFLESDEYALRKCKEKQEYLKEKILNFCDGFDEKLNIGIKKIIIKVIKIKHLRNKVLCLN